jgi:hypothetical protein
MRKLFRPAFVALLIFLCGGIVFDPFWWYRLIRQRQYDNWDLWLEPVNYAIALLWTIFFAVVTIYSVLVLSKTDVPDKLLSGSKSFWNEYVVGRKRWRVYVGILLVIAAGLSTSGLRSRDEQASQATLKESKENLEKSQLELKRVLKDNSDKNKPPLSEPTAFLFLDKDIVESLYGQYSPDLQRTAVIEEITNSHEIKGEVSIEDYLKTSAGQQYLQKQVSQYQNSPKTPERKLKEVVGYLSEKSLLNKFNGLEPRSDDLKNLDQATHLLTSRYGIVINDKKLRSLRDSLLSEEIGSLEKKLGSLKGMILVEGDWVVQTVSDGYRLRSPFVENVTNPAICEVKLHRDEVPTRTRDILDSLNGKPIRMSMLGNVVVGLSESSRTIQVTPIAAY